MLWCANVCLIYWQERFSVEISCYPVFLIYPFSVHVVTFTFHYQLMHLLIKILSQFTFKTTHVKRSVMCT